MVRLSTYAFRDWTIQETCSALVYKAGFSLKEATEYYLHSFSGRGLEVLLRTGNKLSFMGPNSVALLEYWVENDLLPCSYLYWTKAKTREMLTKSKNDGGMGLSEDVAQNFYNLDGKAIESLISHSFCQNNCLIDLELYESLKSWIFSLRETELLVPLIGFNLMNISITMPVFDNSMPYQNNKKCVQNMAVEFLHNLNTEEIRCKSLVCNFSHFGFGKTRFGVQFLKLLRNAISDESVYIDGKSFSQYLMDQFSTDQIHSLLNAKMVYINFVEITENVTFDIILSSCIVNTLKVPPPNDSKPFEEWIASLGPIYIILDEFQIFLKQTAIDQNTVKSYHIIWNSSLVKLQKLSNVFLYICGKGLLFDLIEKGQFREESSYRSPTAVYSVNLSSLDIGDIKTIMTHFQHFKSLPDEVTTKLANHVHEMTGGVPILVHYAFMYSNPDIQASFEGIKQTLDNNISHAPPQTIKPYGNANFSRILKDMYKVLVWASILKKTFSTKDSITVSEIPEFSGLENISILHLSIFCNCYVEEVADQKGRFQFVFPKCIIDSYIEDNDLDISHIYQISKQYPFLVSNDHILEYLTDFYLVIPSKSDLTECIGPLNAMILKKLPDWKNQDINLKDIMDVVVKGWNVIESKETIEPKKKKSKKK
ncbi:predicted protein [Naegleria gruberi]|uniref:Predicted protein n=1 Tax=Naegleria gruberi TaxID=5762 RepID=D2W0H9_NAEGR|nr:uncharacterized protein NAEGRDRAFT_53730 [Naegleria gruberi]EFC37431.1 predicted protein [Naegleria gruberi]|eukprot:XP_002670175.1 predicted protein [Naegleria gruberi strain NEG-M]